MAVLQWLKFAKLDFTVNEYFKIKKFLFYKERFVIINKKKFLYLKGSG